MLREDGMRRELCARSDWLSLLILTVASPHKTTGSLARTQPRCPLPLVLSIWFFRNYELSGGGEAIPCMASRTIRGHFEDSPTLSCQHRAGNSLKDQEGVKLGKNLSAFLSHFWRQTRDSEAAGVGHHLSDRHKEL